jgi:pantothenate kinase
MDKDIWQRLVNIDLSLDRTDAPLELDPSQIERFYFPLALDLLNRSAGTERLMAAVAGPPASGKTAFSVILTEVINAHADRTLACWLGLDGWHYPNAYLDSHTIKKDKNTLTLRQIKGSPATFNVPALRECLEQIRRRQPTSFPVYSRRIHDPVPNAGSVEATSKIVLVEGNYLLLADNPWQALHALFDVKIFLTAPPDMLIEGIRLRHLRGGKEPEEVERQILQVDVPNIKLVLANSMPADILVEKIDSKTIEKVNFGLRGFS